MIHKRTDFLEALKVVMPGIATGLEKKQAFDHSKMFTFDPERIVTYDSETFVSHPYLSDIKGGIDAKLLYQVFHTMRAKDQEEIELWMEGDILHYKAGSDKGTLSTVPETKIAEVVEELGFHNITDFKAVPELWNEAVWLCMFSVEKKESVRWMNCIHMKDQWITSTDDYRISRYALPEPFEGDVSVPLRTAVNIPDYNITEYHVAPNFLHLRNDAGTLYSSSLDFDAQEDVHVCFEDLEGMPITFPEGLEEKLRTAEIIIEHLNFLERYADITCKPGELSIRTAGQGRGTHIAQLDMDYDGPPIEFSINVLFLRSILPKMREARVNVKKGRALFITDNFEHVMSLSVSR